MTTLKSLKNLVAVIVGGDTAPADIPGTTIPEVIDYLAEKAGISKRSEIEYNKILEKEKLLYIHRQNDFVIDDKNNIKSLS